MRARRLLPGIAGSVGQVGFDEDLEQLVAVDTADEAARVAVGRDVSRVLRQNITYDLVDRIISFLPQSVVYCGEYLLDLSLFVLVDGKRNGRFLHLSSPLLYSTTFLCHNQQIFVNLSFCCKYSELFTFEKLAVEETGLHQRVVHGLE